MGKINSVYREVERMRLPIIAGNWKMNTTVKEAVELVKGMLSGMDKIEGVKLW